MDIIKLSPEGLKKALEVVGKYVGHNRTNESRREIKAALREAGFDSKESDRFKGYKADKLYDLLKNNRITTLDREEQILLPEVNKKKATQVKFEPAEYNYGKPYAAIVTFDVVYFTGREKKTIVYTFSKRPTLEKIMDRLEQSIEVEGASYGVMPDLDTLEIKIVRNTKANVKRLEREAKKRAEERKKLKAAKHG